MDTIDPTRFIFAFLFVLGLIGLMAAALRYWSKNRSSLGGRFFARSSDEAGRLSIVETRYIDPRRRLIIVRRDDREHLLLLADGREQLIESFPATADGKAAS